MFTYICDGSHRLRQVSKDFRLSGESFFSDTYIAWIPQLYYTKTTLFKVQRKSVHVCEYIGKSYGHKRALFFDGQDASMEALYLRMALTPVSFWCQDHKYFTFFGCRFGCRFLYKMENDMSRDTFSDEIFLLEVFLFCVIRPLFTKRFCSEHSCSFCNFSTFNQKYCPHTPKLNGTIRYNKKYSFFETKMKKGLGANLLLC